MVSEACPVCCLILNVETPARVRARREAGAQAMARIPGRVEPCGGHPIANDQGHGFAREATNRDSPVSIDGPEDR